MARISIDLPEIFPFQTEIPVRITDLNYGGHVGNDALLSLIHEARMRFLAHFGYSEKDLGGVGMIMADVGIVYKQELFYGDRLRVHVAVIDLRRAAFDLIYKLEKLQGEKWVDVAHAKTGMVCFDYEKRKVAAMPDSVRTRWS